jgi:hypothetical protein
MDWSWIGEAISLVTSGIAIWQRQKAKRARQEADEARAKAERTALELDAIRDAAGTKGPEIGRAAREEWERERER